MRGQILALRRLELWMIIAACPRVLPAVSARVKLRLNIGSLPGPLKCVTNKDRSKARADAKEMM